MDEVRKYGWVVPVSEALARDTLTWQQIEESLQRTARMSPEERAARKREAEERRAAERVATPVQEDVVAGIANNLGLSPEFVRHLAQPYCRCDLEQYGGGWDYCDHARDLGLT